MNPVDKLDHVSLECNTYIDMLIVVQVTPCMHCKGNSISFDLLGDMPTALAVTLQYKTRGSE